MSGPPRLKVPADDFSIPENKTWKISEIMVTGFYGANTTDNDLIGEGMELRIYQDNNGIPADVPWITIEGVTTYYPMQLL